MYIIIYIYEKKHFLFVYSVLKKIQTRTKKLNNYKMHLHVTPSPVKFPGGMILYYYYYYFSHLFFCYIFRYNCLSKFCEQQNFLYILYCPSPGFENNFFVTVSCQKRNFWVTQLFMEKISGCPNLEFEIPWKKI